MLEIALLEQIAAQAETFKSHREIGRAAETTSSDQIAGRVQKAIQALRQIQDLDWNGFFEQNNTAERYLRQDPAGAYPNMDDDSRQIYRTAVEELARQSLFSEEEVARQAVFMAMRAKSRTSNPDFPAANRRTHVGYYLIAEGSRTLKRRLGYKPSWRQRIRKSSSSGQRFITSWAWS